MVRPAQNTDIIGIMAVAEASKEIMQASGNYQWNKDYPLRKDFEQDIIEGTLYVIDENGVVAGIICLNEDEPEEYAKAVWENAGKALFIHRMAVLPEFRGRGFAGDLLTFAYGLAREKGMRSIKTDTFSGNIPMNSLFLKHGFRMAGAVELKKKEQQPFYCYEKILGENPSEH